MRAIWEIFASDMQHLLRNVIAGVVVVGLVLVPPLYAWFTTLGFWDPYSNTGNLKVAVASNDEGYASDLIPTRINAGEQVISALRANDQFDWQFVSEEEAVGGVDSGEYYAAMIIPKDFSADLMTVFSDHITDAKIIYYSNEKENAIAQRVTSTGATTLQETVDETFAETVASVALGTTSSLTSFMNGDGILSYGKTLVSRLSEGADELNTAASQATTYADLMGSTATLVDAASSIMKDAAEAPDATASLMAETHKSLSNSQSALQTSADEAEKALDSAQASYDAVAQAADAAFDTMAKDPAAAESMLQTARSDVATLKEAYQSMEGDLKAIDPDSDALAALNKAVTELDRLDETLQEAQTTVKTDATALEKARAKVDDAIAKADSALSASEDTYNTTLKSELERLSNSRQQVDDDTEELSSSLTKTAGALGDSTASLSKNLTEAEQSLRATADTLHEAYGELTQARDDLQHALDTGDINEVRRIIGNNPDAIAQFLSAPTQLERHAVYAMANNGSAMSPFYTSLCLWIGAIFMVALMSVQVSPERLAAVEKRTGKPPTQAEQYLGRYGVFCVLGLLQALIVGLGNVFFLGVECEHFWLYLAACCLASVVFTNLVYTLTVSFGNIGKAIAIIGLVMQLGGAGGLMPVQMLSASLFQTIYPWLPFAHSMPALEGAMAGIYGNQYLVQMGELATFLVPSLILGLALRRPVIRLNNWVLRKLDETKVV